MKKIIIVASSLAMCVALCACGTSANNVAVNRLGSQLDETSNSISNIQTVNPTDLSISKSILDNVATNASISTLQSNIDNTQQTLLNEEYYKIDILNKTAKIKSHLSKDIKLSKSQMNAVRDLTSNLSKYTNSIEYTQNDMNMTAKSISTMKKNAEKNVEKINAKLNRLACASNSRSSYYENLLTTLSQLENCLNIYENETETQEENTSSQSNTSEETENNSQENCEICEVKNNCDNCNSTNNCSDCNTTNDTDSTTQNNVGNTAGRYGRFVHARNIDTYGPTLRNIDTFGYNGYGYGMNGGMYGGYGANGYGIGYGNRVGANGMYGGYGAYGYGANTGLNGGIYNSNNINRASTPFLQNETALVNKNIEEPRLEDFEKIAEDKTIEKDNDSIKNNDLNSTNEIDLNKTESNTISTTANLYKKRFEEENKEKVPFKQINFNHNQRQTFDRENKDDLDLPIVAH